MEMVNFSFRMVATILESGRIIKCMVKVLYFIRMDKLLMKVNGRKTNLMVMLHFIIKILSISVKLLNIKILIYLIIIGLNIQVNFKMIVKRA